MARARRSEAGGSWLGGAQLWLVARPPLKKRLTRVLERCSPGGAPCAPCTSGFSFFRFSSGDRERGLEWRGQEMPPQMVFGGWEEAWAGNLGVLLGTGRDTCCRVQWSEGRMGAMQGYRMPRADGQVPIWVGVLG